MGMFVREDPGYDENTRQTGFNRYKQLMSVRFAQWWKINLITLLGFVPLTAGILYSIAVSSMLVLIPCSILGGMIAGPFLAGLYDAILRGLRSDPLPWRDAYGRSWKQNWKESLIPGALLGLMSGLYSFMAMLFWWAEKTPGIGTLALYLFSLLLVLVIFTLYWPQMVLFNQSPVIRLRNCLLLFVKYFWRVMGAGLLQLAFIVVYILFAPWSALLLLVIGAWYIVFLAQFLIYDQLDRSLHIEEQFGSSAYRPPLREQDPDDGDGE